MKLKCKWTHDCQGKQDYDADLVLLSTRYWPRGGGFFMFDTATSEFSDNETRPDIKPSAHAAIVIQDEDIVVGDFEGETEEEVKAAVESWAQAMFDRIETAIRKEFASQATPP